MRIIKNILLLIASLALLSSCGGGGGGGSSESVIPISTPGEELGSKELFDANMIFDGTTLKKNNQNVAVKYTGGIPKNTHALDLFLLDPNVGTIAEDNIEKLIRDFLRNVKQVKEQGGSISLADSVSTLPKSYGYSNFILNIVEEESLTAAKNIVIDYDTSEMFVIEKELCDTLAEGSLHFKPAIESFTTGSIILLEKDCGLELEPYSADTTISAGKLYYNPKDVTHAYSYEFSNYGSDLASKYRHEPDLIGNNIIIGLSDLPQDLNDIEDFNKPLYFKTFSYPSNEVILQDENGLKYNLQYQGYTEGIDNSVIEAGNDEAIKKLLEPMIIELEDNIAKIKGQGGSLHIDSGDYNKFQQYFSLIWALGEYEGLEKKYPYFSYKLESSNRHPYVFIITKEACEKISEAGVSFIGDNGYSVDGVLVMEESCPIEVGGSGDKIDNIEAYLSIVSDFKRYRYKRDGANIIFRDFNDDSEVEDIKLTVDYPLQGANTDTVLDSIEDFDSRILLKLEDYSINGNYQSLRMYYKGVFGRTQLEYNGGIDIPEDISELLLKPESELKNELADTVVTFENNIASIKSQGGSFILKNIEKHALAGATEGYQSFIFALFEERTVITNGGPRNSDAEFSGFDELLILTESACKWLKSYLYDPETFSNSNLASLDMDLGDGIILMDEKCELELNSRINLISQDLKYLYKYTKSGNKVTFGENLVDTLND